jgi:AraC-like DNA-binding protein
MTTTPANPEARTSYATYALQLLELTKRWGIPAAELLSPLGLDEALLEDPRAALSREAWLALLDRARKLTGEPAIGVHLGLQMRISAFGFLGFTAMSAPTLGDALALATQFAPVITNAFELRLHVVEGTAAFVVGEKVAFGGVRDVVLTSVLVGLAKIGSSLVGRDLPVSIDLVISEPPYYARFAHVLPPIRFDQPVNQLVAEAKVMGWKLATADKIALRLAREQCVRELDALCSQDLLVDRVRRLLPTDDGFRAVGQVAAAVHMSTRTLKRRLAEQGITYSSLVDAERRDKALLLLRAGDPSVNEVARQLGYSALSAFIRAFHRWTGTTPTEYRRRHARERGPRGGSRAGGTG